MEKRKIVTQNLDWFGKAYKLRYWDLDSFDLLKKEKCRQIYGVCFYKDKIVIGRGGRKGGWGLIGGTIEEGESFEETFKREIIEESNMNVLKWSPVGVQEVIDPKGKSFYQLRCCAIVKPLGEFKEDPAGSVKEIKLIDPRDYKKYFDWGKIGERIIERAFKLKRKLQD